MYKALWILINHISDKESAAAIYLAANIICWTTAAILLGITATFFLQIQLTEALVNIVCAGAYAGIIFGLIGGILFLQRKPGKE